MTPRLIIFDFDGTLADTTATILRTFAMTIAKLGAEPRSAEQCRATIGLPLKESFARLYPSYADCELNTCVDTYRLIFNQNKKSLVPKLYPGVKETLASLARRGAMMSIASSRSRESLLEFCQANEIAQYFALILGADDVAHAKPHPEPVLTTLERLGFKASEAVVIGDMPVDIAMGSGAGCYTIGVTYGNSSRRELEESGADRIIDSFTDIRLF